MEEERLMDLLVNEELDERIPYNRKLEGLGMVGGIWLFLADVLITP